MQSYRVMNSWHLRGAALLLLGTLTLGCSDDADGSGGDDASGGTGTGATGSGAGSAMGGSGASTGEGGGECLEDTTTCVNECPIDDTLLAILQPCEPETCGFPSYCVPTSFLPNDPAQLALLSDCADGKCVPEKFVLSFNQFDLVNCTSVNGFEGRCVSECLPSVAAQADFLPTEGCGVGERCAPCFDPFTGEPTGACGLSCDDPATSTPEDSTFTECCVGLGGGNCLPSSLAGAAGDMLDTSECEAAGEPGNVCVPTIVYQQVTAQGFFQGAPCDVDTVIVFTGTSNEGACLPRCIPEVAAQVQMIEDQDEFGLTDVQQDCPDGFACLPCINQGMFTGACDPQGG